MLFKKLGFSEIWTCWFFFGIWIPGFGLDLDLALVFPGNWIGWFWSGFGFGFGFLWDLDLLVLVFLRNFGFGFFLWIWILNFQGYLVIQFFDFVPPYAGFSKNVKREVD